MKRNFFIGTTILSVVCVNVNNALCDCCSVCKEKKFIAKALGIKEGDIWFIKKFKGKNIEEKMKTFFDKQGEDFKTRKGNSHIVSLFVGSFDASGESKEDDCYVFYVLIDKEKNIKLSSELLEKEVDVNTFFAENEGKNGKFIVVQKYDEDCSIVCSCKKK